MKTNLDHIVVVANTLEQGVQWCEATLGITPAPGGEHAQFGTHNRLFKIATPAHPMKLLRFSQVQKAQPIPMPSAGLIWTTHCLKLQLPKNLAWRTS
jgi:hypothetical protein